MVKWYGSRITTSFKRVEAQNGDTEWKKEETSVSLLKDTGHCCLCESDNRSLMNYYKGQDELGIICVNNWHAMG